MHTEFFLGGGGGIVGKDCLGGVRLDRRIILKWIT
jgi:hypothetical protein